MRHIPAECDMNEDRPHKRFFNKSVRTGVRIGLPAVILTFAGYTMKSGVDTQNYTRIVDGIGVGMVLGGLALSISAVTEKEDFDKFEGYIRGIFGRKPVEKESQKGPRNS